MNNVLQEVKHFKQYARQLNLLLDETYKSIQELKALQTPLSGKISYTAKLCLENSIILF